MSSFSNLIDISSFFIGVLINLLLVALICYYFKRKIDNLELAQSEQAKMLYTMIHNQEQEKMQQAQMGNHNEFNTESMSFLNNLDLSHLENNVVESNIDTDMLQIQNERSFDADEDNQDSDNNSDSDSESGSESEDEDNEDTSSEVAQESMSETHEDDQDEIVEENIKTIEVQMEIPQEQNYEKMTIKELKQVLESRGNSIPKRNIKKQELIDMLISIDDQEELTETEDEPEQEQESEPEPEKELIEEVIFEKKDSDDIVTQKQNTINVNDIDFQENNNKDIIELNNDEIEISLENGEI